MLAGNPSHIDGPSPLKRVGDVGHAIALLRSRQRKDGLEILVDDQAPYRTTHTAVSELSESRKAN